MRKRWACAVAVHAGDEKLVVAAIVNVASGSAGRVSFVCLAVRLSVICRGLDCERRAVCPSSRKDGYHGINAHK